MSALGQKQTCAARRVMSALHPKATPNATSWNARLGQKRTLRRSHRSGKYRGHSRQSHPDFGELTRLRIDLDGATMLFDNDIVTDGEPKPSSFSGRLGCEEGVEDLFFYFRWNTRAVIPNPDFHTIAKAAGRGHQGW